MDQPMRYKYLILLFLLGTVCIPPLRAQEQNELYFDHKTLFLEFPTNAFPLAREHRNILLDSMLKSRGYLNHGNYYLSAVDSSFFGFNPMPLPNDSQISRSYPFRIQVIKKNGPNEAPTGFYFEYAIFVNLYDTFVLSKYQGSHTSAAESQSQPRIKLYKLKKGEFFIPVPIPEVKPEDFGLEIDDKEKIAEANKRGEIQLNVYMDQEGFIYSLRDLSLNYGPIEPPQTRPLKFESDFRTISNPIRISILPNKIVL